MTVGEIMVRAVRTVPATAMLSEAMRIMQQECVGCLAVLGDRGRLVGIVTDRDAGMAELNGRPEHVPVGQVARGPVVTIGAEATLAEAARLMEDRGVRRLPVLDGNGALVGIVTLSDLARRAADRDDRDRVAHALGALAEHR